MKNNLSLKKTAEKGFKTKKRAKELKDENETLKTTVKDLEKKYKGYAYRNIPYRKTALAEITKGLCCNVFVDTEKKEITVKCPVFEVAMLDKAIQQYEQKQQNQQTRSKGQSL